MIKACNLHETVVNECTIEQITTTDDKIVLKLVKLTLILMTTTLPRHIEVSTETNQKNENSSYFTRQQCEHKYTFPFADRVCNIPWINLIAKYAQGTHIFLKPSPQTACSADNFHNYRRVTSQNCGRCQQMELKYPTYTFCSCYSSRLSFVIYCRR